MVTAKIGVRKEKLAAAAIGQTHQSPPLRQAPVKSKRAMREGRTMQAGPKALAEAGGLP